ncbi:hypothetical protein M0Q50_10530 [bacterium]|jgi:hypothetical protein|nr:hypothetical protein [bacterium]
MTKFKGKEYISINSLCNKRKCFLPFTGNGTPICRLYEMGQCRWNDKLKKQDECK